MKQKVSELYYNVKKRGIEFLVKNPRLYDRYEKYKSKKRKSAEDIFLRNAINELNGPIKIIQIGANDGLRSDPVRPLIIDYNCEAVFIEADPICFQVLKRNYSYLQNGNLKFSNYAIVPIEKEDLVFYSLSDEYRKTIKLSKQIKHARKSSMNKELLVNYFNKIGIKDVESVISEQSIETITLNALIEANFIPNILVVDTEGLDWDLMNSLNLSKFLPEIVLFESSFKPDNVTEESVLEKFRNNGYEIVEFKYNIGCLLKK